MRSARVLVILPPTMSGSASRGRVDDIRAQLPQVDILVINDGSGDATAAAAEDAGALVLNLPYNVGIGAAVQAGFQFAAAHGYDIVLRNDGDGQHAPESNRALLAALDARAVDVVIGSRFISEQGDYGTPVMRRLGSAILARLLSSIIGQRVTDPDLRLLGLQSPRHQAAGASLPARLPRAGSHSHSASQRLAADGNACADDPAAARALIDHGRTLGLLYDQGHPGHLD